MPRAIELLRNKFGVSQLYKHVVNKDGEELLTVYWHPLTIAERESIQKKAGSDDAADFALTLKMVVKDLSEQGKTEEQIYSFLSDKYGDWIVFKPQFNAQNSLLWILPYIALIFGGFFIFSFLKKRQ